MGYFYLFYWKEHTGCWFVCNLIVGVVGAADSTCFGQLTWLAGSNACALKAAIRGCCRNCPSMTVTKKPTDFEESHSTPVLIHASQAPSWYTISGL